MKLFHREYGKGKPLVILHGILGISDNWVSFGRKMAETGIHVFIPDQRNHGQSPHHPVFNFDALLEDLLEFIEVHHIKKPIILGHSMGGKLAMRYALENPDEVEKLIIVDTSLRTYVHVEYHQQLIDAMLSVDLDNTESRHEVEKALMKQVKEDRIRDFLLKNLYWIDKTKLGWRPNLKAISENLDAIYDGIFYSARYEKPALFIRGGNSNYVTDQDFQAIHQNFPYAVIRTVKDATHWVHADEPQIFFNLVNDFINK
jgi:esterase